MLRLIIFDNINKGFRMMKKLNIAVGVIVAFGIMWISGAWYTGKSIEDQYQQQISKINHSWQQQSQFSGILTQIEDVQVERGIFRSDFRYRLNIKSHSLNLNLPFEGTLYHGPLPLNQVAILNLVPAMFSTSAKLVENEETAKRIQTHSNESPISIVATMSYRQNVKGETTFMPAQLTTDDIQLNWDKGRLQFDLNALGIGQYDMDFTKLNMVLTDYSLKAVMADNGAEHLKKMTIEFDHLKSSSDMQPTVLSLLYTGKGKISTDNLRYVYSYSTEPSVTADFAKLTIDFDAKQDKDVMNYALSVTTEPKFNDYSLGKLAFALNTEHLSVQTLNAILATDPNDEKIMQRLGLELLQDQPHVQIKPLSLNNNAGKIEANVDIALFESDFTKAFNGKILSLFKQLSINLNVDKAAAVEFLSILEQSTGQNKVNADIQAQQQIDMLVTQGKAQGVIVEKDNELSLAIGLEKDGINFNGNIIPEEYIGMAILGLMMQGVGH